MKPTTLLDAVATVMPSVLASAVILLGMLMLYDLIIRGLVSPDAGLAIISGIIGSAVALVFQNKTINDTARAVTNGAATAAVKRAREIESQAP